MNNKSKPIIFWQNRIHKSFCISLLIENLYSLAQFVIVVWIIDIISIHVFKGEDFLSTLQGYFLLILFIMTLIEKLLLPRSITSINISEKKLVIRSINRFYIPSEKNVMDIRKISLSPYYRPMNNIVITTQDNKRVTTSINDKDKFVKLLHNINPAIEVEYTG
jgi:hypothetical protein